ncbi:MAG: tRNA pseudouridine(55) synthase TruB [Eubacteriales bacterium]
MESTDYNGIINVLKPPGMTSHDVVNYLRRGLKIKKTGHTGTLDPGVAGVLPVCLGKATKIIEYMANDIKMYRAEATFGRSTDTQDGFGETVRVCDTSGLTEAKVAEAFGSLQGRQSQVPPMVSALKYKGRRLYELAREGIEVERKPRIIEIFKSEIIRYTGFGTPNPAVLFDIECSKGTYVRTICHDLGNLLGYCGFMSFLVRTGTGRYKISEALTLEEITDLIQSGRIREAILPPEEALDFKKVWVSLDVVQAVAHGNRIYQAGIEVLPDGLKENEHVILMNTDSGCLAVAKVLCEGATSGLSAEDCTRYSFQPVKVLC